MRYKLINTTIMSNSDIFIKLESFYKRIHFPDIGHKIKNMSKTGLSIFCCFKKIPSFAFYMKLQLYGQFIVFTLKVKIRKRLPVSVIESLS